MAAIIIYVVRLEQFIFPPCNAYGFISLSDPVANYHDVCHSLIFVAA